MPRPATASDLPQLAAVLASAFHDYAWTKWTVPAQQHQDRIRTLQHIYLEHIALPHGMVWTTDDLAAAAAFVPTLPPVLAPAVVSQLTALHAGRFEALIRAEELLAARRPPHDWTLATIGVAPHAQGRGLGMAIAAAGLDVVDQQQGICLVETSDPANVPFYQRLNFRVEDVVQTDGPPVWIMVRPAATR